MTRRRERSRQKRYDVALSFAGEQRDYVRAVNDELVRLGVRTFFDESEEVTLWGKDLPEHLYSVYRNHARYVVPFVSREYEAKAYPRVELRAAVAAAMNEHTEYILPVMWRDWQLSGLLETVKAISTRGRTPATLAQLIAKKVATRSSVVGSSGRSSGGRTARSRPPTNMASIRKMDKELQEADEARQRAGWADQRERVEAAKAASLYYGPRRVVPSDSIASKARELARKHDLWPDVRARLRYLVDQHRECDQDHQRDERRFRRVHAYTCDFLSRAFGDADRDAYRQSFDRNSTHTSPLVYGRGRALDLLCHAHARFLEDLAKSRGPSDIKSRFHLDPEPRFD
jgi:hypothetical protein